MYYNEKLKRSNVSDAHIYKNSSENQKDLPAFVDKRAWVSLLGETPHEQIYQDCDVYCPLKGIDKIIDSVSIIPFKESNYDLTFHFVNHSKITNRLPVINSHNGGTGTKQVKNENIGVCVKPIWGNYSKTLEIVEFIELNKLLGVSKFFIYNESISDEVSCVLNYYKDKENLVSVVPWNLPSKIEIDYLPNRGVMSSLNDCIYRNMNDFRYLMTIDLDEFIIPHKHESIPEMLKYLDSQKHELYKEITGTYYKPKHLEISLDWKQNFKNRRLRRSKNLITSYNFQNAFFYLGFGKKIPT